MRDEDTGESVAKRPRVDASLMAATADEAPEDVAALKSGGDDTSTEEEPDGINRSAVSFSMDDDEENDHNYSITSRWRQRLGRWKELISELVPENFDAHEWKEMSGKKLFLQIDRSSHLGKVLIDFSEMLETKTKELRENEKELRDLQREVDAPVPQQAASREVETELKRKLIEKNEKLIQYNQKFIEGETKSIENNLEAICTAHENLRNMFAFVKSKGNESLLSLTSNMRRSIDKARFDPTKEPSPSKFEAFAEQKSCSTFTGTLISMVPEKCKETLLLFQTFVIDLFKNAAKTADAVEVKKTTDAIRDWNNKDTSVDRSVSYARPPTSHDNETEADQPIVHAVICRIMRILAEQDKNDDKDGEIHGHELDVTTELSVAGPNFRHTKERRVDVVIHPFEEYLPLALEIAEIKTARDEKPSSSSHSKKAGRK